MSEKEPKTKGIPETPPGGDTAKQLANLRGNLLAYRDEPIRPEKPRPSHESTEETIPEKMDAPERERMQSCQEAIFRQYLNPSFYLYMKMTGKLKNVDKAFETAMENPEKLHYIKEKDGTMTVTRRPAIPGGTKVRDFDVPAGFYMKMEGGYITQVNGEKVDVRANKEYQTMHDRVISFISKLADSIKLREALKAQNKWDAEIKAAWMEEVMEKVVEPNIDINNAYMMEYPHRLVNCMKYRNQTWNLQVGNKKETELESYTSLASAVDEHGHDALADNEEETVEVEIRDGFPDYVFILDENGDDLCAVTKEGYFVQQDEDGNWTGPYADYKGAVKNAYETKYPD
ncbi:hypothetical protein JXA05_04545 [Candidatus Peregrinibacteria bacterium]|nr:hypothetical protein [Candidatus Peregrinibacteria bacterium]